jgi:hypothetical protein
MNTYQQILGIAAAASCMTMAGNAISDCTANGARTEAGKFVLMKDVVLDERTNLQWARCSLGQQWQEAGGCVGTPKKFTYDEATKATLPAGWRLPTPEELKTLVDEGCKNPTIDPRAFPNTPPDPYWAVDKRGCWLVNFGAGVTYGPNSYLCGYGNVSAVRLVRSSSGSEAATKE